MITLTYDEKLGGNNTWNFYRYSDGSKSVITRCSNGHIGSLDNHSIAEEGMVSPSVVCQHADCNFHEFIKLMNWKEHRDEEKS